MEELVNRFRETIKDTSLVKEFPSEYGDILITIHSGKIQDIIPAPVFRSPLEVKYPLENTSVSGG